LTADKINSSPERTTGCPITEEGWFEYSALDELVKRPVVTSNLDLTPQTTTDKSKLTEPKGNASSTSNIDWNFPAPKKDTTSGTSKILLPRVDLFVGTDYKPLQLAVKREDVLTGGVKDGAWEVLQRFNLDKTLCNDVRTEINREGMDMLQVATNAMRKSRVLGIGEMHNEGSPHRKFVASNMAALKGAGATHLAVELPSSNQVAVMRAIREGKAVDTTLDSFFSENPEMLQMLRNAVKAGLQVVAVDLTDVASTSDIVHNKDFELTRDEYMAKKIEEILTADAKNKVVYWCGGLHVVDPEKGGDQQRLSAGKILRAKYPVTTVFDQTPRHRHAVSLIANDIAKPVAVPTAKAPKLAGIGINPSSESWNVKYGNWDYIFIYPNK